VGIISGKEGYADEEEADVSAPKSGDGLVHEGQQSFRNRAEKRDRKFGQRELPPWPQAHCNERFSRRLIPWQTLRCQNK
jgi:hypothetical protein